MAQNLMQWVAAWMVTLAARVRDEETGATAVEYGLMVALIAAVIISAVGLLGGQVKTAFCSVVAAMGGHCTT